MPFVSAGTAMLTVFEVADAAKYRPLIVAYRNGAPVRLEDVAKIVDSVENDQVAGWLNGERSVILAVQRQPDANTVQVVDAVKALVPVFEAELPASVKLTVLSDRSVSIRNSVDDVQFTLMLTVVLVGSSASRAIALPDGRRFAYTPRGYEKKFDA